LRDLLLVALGGAIGAGARHLASKAALTLLPATFPWGTWLINISGCLLMGVVAGFASASAISPSARLFVATGVLGGYTTFSAFGLEAQGLVADERWMAAAAYAVGQVLLGVLGIYAGLAIARRFA
jgi:CrcB protein